jgi:hypothetical protein
MSDIYNGSCHCGEVTFQVETGLNKVMECNCSHCYRKGLLLTFVEADKFKLLSGEASLVEYRFHKHVITHLSCHTCSVQPFARGKRDDGSDMVAVNVRTLEDVEPWSLSTSQVDGRRF